MDDEKRGKFLCDLRKEKNMTQQQLGEIIHYTDKAISKWERGLSFPNNPVTLEQLAEIFDVTVEELLYGERKNRNNALAISKAILKELKNRYHRYRKSVIAIVIFFLIIIIATLMFIYFVFIKEQIVSYYFYAENDNFTVANSSLLITNRVNIMNFNEVDINGDKEIDNIRLYYYEDDNVVNIFNGKNDNYYIEELYGYDELKLDKLIKHDVYLEIVYDEEIYTLKVKFVRKYINDTVLPRKVSEISGDEETNELSEFEKFLVKEGFTRSGDSYTKEINNAQFNIFNFDKFSIFISNGNTLETVNGNFYDELLLYEKKLNEESTITKNIKIKGNNSCTKNCKNLDDYISYINYLKENYEIKK